MGAVMAGLPEGFTIDQAPAQASNLPEGFTIDAPGANLPDVGAPALSWGPHTILGAEVPGSNEQLSPGLPVVNERADKWSESANRNLIAPFAHPIDTATGIARLAAGAAQYVGAPGDEYKKDVDRLIKDYADTYGSWDAFRQALWDDPFRVIGDLQMGRGALGVLGRRAGVLPRAAPRVEAPTIEQLYDSAEGHYNAMHGFGVELDPRVMADTAQNIENALDAVGYDADLAPHTYRIVDKLRNPPGPTTTTMNVESVRRQLNKAAGLPGERDAARRAISEIDDTMANLTPADAVVNGHFAPRVAQEALAARGDYAAAKHAETVEAATNKAELQAASTGSGSNIDNAVRQQFKAILNSPTKRRGFSQDTLDLMESLVRGTPVGNAARFLGKLAPTGVVSAGLGAALGHAVGHTIGVPVLGAASKALADAATRRLAARVSEDVRLRSPEARRIGAVAAPPPNIGRGIARVTIPAGRAQQLGNGEQ